MAITIERAQAADMPAILALLAQAGLPPDGLADHLPWTLVARTAGRVIGSVALEIYGPAALLRSVAVAADQRGMGLGGQLTAAALDVARAAGVHDVYLLTTTAAGFFPRFGFQPVARAAVAPAIHQSVEWASACPASAQVLVRALGD